MPRNVINGKVARLLGEYDGADSQTFAGTDIKAVMYLPLLTTNTLMGKDTPKIKVFADLQTISVSSARSISPVRVLGKSNPKAFTRGAITYAGTMVFATINRDAFSEVYDTSLAEGYMNASSSIMAHQLPPFSIVITAGNEKGAAGIQVIHGITLTNYGTTYSVDDLYTETSYTYVATDVSPLVPASDELKTLSEIAPTVQRFGKSITDLLSEGMDKVYDAARMQWRNYYTEGAAIALRRNRGPAQRERIQKLVEEGKRQGLTEQQSIDRAYGSRPF